MAQAEPEEPQFSAIPAQLLEHLADELAGADRRRPIPKLFERTAGKQVLLGRAGDGAGISARYFIRRAQAERTNFPTSQASLVLGRRLGRSK